MKRAYELTFIVRLDQSEDAVNAVVDTVQSWVQAEELGQVTKINRWGRKKLAYLIDNQRDGYYVNMEAEIEPRGLPELERNLKLAPTILRYLLINPEN